VKSSSLKSEIESELASRFGDAITLREKPATECASTGIPELDSITGGLPRGAITEILGQASSGRTSLLLSALAAATYRDEVSALVDASDMLDAASAAEAGIDLDKLLWVRCGANVDHALKATDLLLQSGGFGLIALDLGDVPTRQAQRIPSSWWHRFRRAIETTPTALVVIEREPNSRACASLALQMNKENAATWSSTGNQNELAPACSLILSGSCVQVVRNKPIRMDKTETRIECRASHT